MRKTLTIGLVLPLLLLGAAGALAEGQGEAAAGPMEISWLGLYSTDIVDDNPIQQHLEEMFPVKFINTLADYSETEQNTLRVAADEHPDAMYTWGPNRLEWYLKGAFRSIPRSMIEEHMPNYVKSMNELGAGSWFYGLVPGSSDEYYGIPRRVDYQDGCGYLPQMRLDWLEQGDHGLTPSALNADALEDLAPTAAPGTYMRWLDQYTWDQLETILRSYAAGDFDGNGQDDTIAFGWRGQALIHWSGAGLVFYSYGVNEVDNYLETDGSTVKAATYSRSKAALQKLQQWWQEGLMDSELPAVDNTLLTNKIIQGQVGSFMRTRACGRGVELGNPPDLCAQNVQQGPDPNAKWLTTLMPISPFGDSRCRMENKAMPINAANGAFVVRHDVSDEKLALILQIYDYTNFDPEGMVIAYYGLPGMHFNWEGEPFASQQIPTDEKRQGGGIYSSTQGILYYNAYSPHEGILQFNRDAWSNNDNEMFGKAGGMYNTSERAYREDLFNQTRYNELWAQGGSALNTIRDDFFWRAITTDLDIEAEWPGYVETWMNNGGRELLDELEMAPTVADIRAGRATPP
jgi:hypothetical protein